MKTREFWIGFAVLYMLLFIWGTVAMLVLNLNEWRYLLLASIIQSFAINISLMLTFRKRK